MSEGPLGHQELLVFFSLPEAVFERILLLLHVRDIAQLGVVCRKLQIITEASLLWRQLCHRQWGRCTDLDKWLDSADASLPLSPAPGSAFRGFRTYKSLYKFLYGTDGLLGFWRSASTPQGCLYVFAWQPDCIQGRELVYDSMLKAPASAPFVSIGPASRASVQMLGKTQCLLKQTSHSSGASSSAAAEACTAVAIGRRTSDPSSESMLGTSPQGSFEYEMYRYMQGTVACSRSARKSKSRSPGQAPGTPVQKTYRLTYVDQAVPTRRHPLSGLWKGRYGPISAREGSVQVVHITYDFTGRAARICAIKVTGNTNIRAGNVTWWAHARAQPEPWSERERAIMGLRWNLLGGDDQLRSSSDSAAPVQAKEVVTCYNGKGHLGLPGAGGGEGGGEEDPTAWVDGRLWHYSDGDIGFVWMDPLQRLVDFKRIDSDL